MVTRLKQAERTDHERRVERLERTVRALARETNATTLGGPCGRCGRCLLFQRGDKMYCPHCGDSQSV